MAFDMQHATCAVCGAKMARGLLSGHARGGDCAARVLTTDLTSQGFRRAGNAWKRFLRLGLLVGTYPTGKQARSEHWTTDTLVREAEGGASDDELVSKRGAHT